MTNTPHDALVKAIFGNIENIQEELQSVMPPELGKLINWNTLKRELN